MTDFLYEMKATELSTIQLEMQRGATKALELGQIIFFQSLPFILQEDEQELLDPAILSPKRKNVSLDLKNKTLLGIDEPFLQSKAVNLMTRYAAFARNLLDQICPHYRKALKVGRTSFRPAEVEGRPTSKRKDDTRLHVDAFPSTPVQNKRILRVFTNLNPYGEPRTWHVGEPFEQVLARFSGQIPAYSALKAHVLHWMKVTKSLRTNYDHQMLMLHDMMKLDDQYQQNVHFEQISFPAKSTWIVYTDQVSHAALKGQFLLEQTFYLPVDAMLDASLSPYKQWEKFSNSGKIAQKKSEFV